MAQQRSHVPKFGNWENEGNVPYTAYFDNARRGRSGPGGRMINPNDPEENPDILSEHRPPADGSLTQGKPEGVVVAKPVVDHVGAAKSASHERQRSKEDGEYRQFANSPANNHGNARRASNDAYNNRVGGGRSGGGAVSGDANRRRQSTGSEHSIEKSPLHRHARPTGRDSPSWEGKSTHEGSHGTPSRSRLKPRGDETPDRSAAVPKFGEWDETNPASADGFTHIFNKVREERTGAGRVATPEPSYPNRRPNPDDAPKGCCFFWSRK